jgi:hypothetical protein
VFHRPYYEPVYDDTVHAVLKAIKENDGFPGPVKPPIRDRVLYWATVETSPVTGADMQWELKPAGKRRVTSYERHQKFMKKHGSRLKAEAAAERARYRVYDRSMEKSAPLTVEVKDALKSIMTEGHPGTTKFDILAWIQQGWDRLAECKDGEWKLSKRGLEIARAHIRKAECAQFSGKVR